MIKAKKLIVRRKGQKKVFEGIIKYINNDIKTDPLWNGRFIIALEAKYFHIETMTLRVALSFTDIKTDDSIIKIFTYDNDYDYLYCNIWNAMNDFVCEQTIKEREKEND